MPRDPRWVPVGGGLDEITCVVIQNRYLLRPSPELNDVVLGVIGYAQRKVGMRICCLTVLSSHYHMLLWPEDTLQGGTHLAAAGIYLAGWPGVPRPPPPRKTGVDICHAYRGVEMSNTPSTEKKLDELR